MSDIPTIAEAAKLIAAKKLSPVELTKACIERTHALDGELHAFILLTEDRAFADARAAEAAIMAGRSARPALRNSDRPEGHRRYQGHSDTTCHSKILNGQRARPAMRRAR